LRYWSLVAAGLATTVLLGGCVLIEPRETASETASSVADPIANIGPPLASFFVSGRLALRQGERRDFLKFDWQHDPVRDTVLLLSPLGQGIAEIVRADDGARLLRPGEAPLEAADIAALTQQLLGTAVPLQELANWLRGAHGAAGEIDGWRIVITQSVAHPTFATGRLPRRIEAHRGEVALTLIVDDWAAAKVIDPTETTETTEPIEPRNKKE
jgi:outer membrane lipoprotein LolB